MKNVVFKNRWIQIVYGALLLVAGILAFVFAIINNEQLTSIISIIVAVCSFILGIVLIASSFASETNVLFPGSLFFGSLFIALGILLCVDTAILGTAICYLAGALLLTYGVVNLVKAIIYTIMRKQKKEPQVKIRYMVLFYSLAAVLIVLGILTFVYNKTASTVIYAGVGIALAVYGIVEIVLGAKRIHDKEKENKVVSEQKPRKEIDVKVNDNNVVDVEIKEPKEEK